MNHLFIYLGYRRDYKAFCTITILYDKIITIKCSVKNSFKIVH